MTTLTKEEVDQIAEALAPKLIDAVKERHHEFWIDPESHYLDHMRIRILEPDDRYDLKQLLALYRMTRSLWFKAFIGAAIVGTGVLTALGMGFKPWS